MLMAGCREVGIDGRWNFAMLNFGVVNSRAWESLASFAPGMLGLKF